MFYDYWKNSTWVNSRSSARDHPETSPLAGTVKKITFKKKKQGLFEGLFNQKK